LALITVQSLFSRKPIKRFLTYSK